MILLVTEAGVWGEPEERLLEAARDRKVSLIPVINKTDLAEPSPEFIAKLREATGFEPLRVSAAGGDAERERIPAAAQRRAAGRGVPTTSSNRRRCSAIS